MTLLAVPNLSEGRNAATLSALHAAVEGAGARILDTHTDAVHNRTVFTVTGSSDPLVEAMVALAVRAAELIDLAAHEGVHPRRGVLDVCPFVPHRAPLTEAVSAALETADRIGAAGLPVFLYEAASPENRPLPLLRRELPRLPPDRGPAEPDPRVGAVCVGARGPLIAFNVDIDAPVDVARQIAEAVRAVNGGPAGVRALGLDMPEGSQVSMNLTDPAATGIETAFAAVERLTTKHGASVVATEIVGLVEERFLPTPDAQAARLLIEPGRSVESLL